MSPSGYQSVFLATASAVGALTLLGIYWYSKKRKNTIPVKWKTVGKVKNIFMYPLKSGRRLELNSAECTSYGLRQIKREESFQLRDRCLVVYKEANKEFKTARTYPKMVLIEVNVQDQDYFVFKAPGMRTLKVKVPTATSNSKGTFIEVFEKEKIYTIDCGDQAAEWFSSYITGEKSGLRLGFHDGIYKRNVDGPYRDFFKVHKNFSNLFLGMYSDLSSFMLMNQASVDELVSRIPGSPVTMNNFRPNIVVEEKNLVPYAEDSWDWIKIGDAIFRAFKPCTRCIFTTIDPETGIRIANSEPLKTLKSYRLLKDLTGIELEGDSPVMGVNLGLKVGGDIHVGDVVYVGRS